VEGTPPLGLMYLVWWEGGSPFGSPYLDVSRCFVTSFCADTVKTSAPPALERYSGLDRALIPGFDVSRGLGPHLSVARVPAHCMLPLPCRTMSSRSCWASTTCCLPATRWGAWKVVLFFAFADWTSSVLLGCFLDASDVRVVLRIPTP